MSLARFRELYVVAQEMNGLEDFSPDADIPNGSCPACGNGYEDASAINAVRHRLYYLLNAIRDGGDLAAIDAYLAAQETT